MTSYSYQLYSSRNFKPLTETLTMLAELGYQQVEGYSGLMQNMADADALASSLKAHGLAMPTCHIGLETLETEPAHAIDLAGKLGIDTYFVPAIAKEDRSEDADDWKKLAERLSTLADSLHKEELSLGWHNHDFEFKPTKSGELPLDLILETAPSLKFEFDLAWCAVAGHNPVTWLEKYRHRIAAAHIKDLAPAGECSDEDGWADVGHGTMDWPGLFAQLREIGVTHYVMEHDNPSDHRRFAARSIAYCQSITV